MNVLRTTIRSLQTPDKTEIIQVMLLSFAVGLVAHSNNNFQGHALAVYPILIMAGYFALFYAVQFLASYTVNRRLRAKYESDTDRFEEMEPFFEMLMELPPAALWRGETDDVVNTLAASYKALREAVDYTRNSKLKKGTQITVSLEMFAHLGALNILLATNLLDKYPACRKELKLGATATQKRIGSKEVPEEVFAQAKKAGVSMDTVTETRDGLLHGLKAMKLLADSPTRRKAVNKLMRKVLLNTEDGLKQLRDIFPPVPEKEAPIGHQTEEGIPAGHTKVKEEEFDPNHLSWEIPQQEQSDDSSKR